MGDAAELVSPDNVFDIARGMREVLLNDEDRRTRWPPRADAGAALSLGRHRATKCLRIYREINTIINKIIIDSTMVLEVLYVLILQANRDGDVRNGMDSFGNTGARHAQLHAMPRVRIALREERERGALQLRAARDFSHLLRPLHALRDAGKALEPGFAGAARGPRTARRPGDEKTKNISPISASSHAALSTNFEHRLFRYHFLLGADWKLCTRKLGMDRGNFFHAVYRIEQKLGRVFRELEPYPLFPLDEYFHGPSRMAPALAVVQPSRVARPEHLQFPVPLRKIA